MRILLVGTVPPPGGAPARRLGALAAARRAAGDEVEIVSPDPRSAAHHGGHLGGLGLALQLARRSRGADALLLSVEEGLPLAPTADRVTRAVTLSALGLVLRLFPDVTVLLPSPVPLPGGVGGRATKQLWARATSIVVSSEEDRSRLLAAPGVVPERVVVEVPREPLAERAERGWASVDREVHDLRATVQSMVRDRAAAGRSVVVARRALGAASTPLGNEDPFAGSPPAPTSLELGPLVLLATRRALRVARRALRARERSGRARAGRGGESSPVGRSSSRLR